MVAVYHGTGDRARGNASTVVSVFARRTALIPPLQFTAEFPVSSGELKRRDASGAFRELRFTNLASPNLPTARLTCALR
jgi:hypothetical protein